MKNLKTVLMERDNLTSKEAEDWIEEVKFDLEERIWDPITYGNPETICEDCFGLEPDYIIDLLT
jgi:hypothetical protein